MRRKETIKRTCVVCKKEFNALRSDANTCSNSCRSKLSRSETVNRSKAKSKLIRKQSETIISLESNHKLHNKTINEILLLVREAEQAAEKDGKFKEAWGRYIKDNKKFSELCRSIK